MKVVIQPKTTTTTTTTTTRLPPPPLSSFHRLGHHHAYCIDSVIAEQAVKGVCILMGSIVEPEEEEEEEEEEEGGLMNRDCMMVVSPDEPVVIKVVPKRVAEGAVEDPIHEIAAMQMLTQHSHHNHVIHLIDCFQDEEYVYLILPFLNGGDLYLRVDGSGSQGLGEEEAIKIFKQMVEGLLFLKRLGLAHHDVSLENVVTDGKQGVVKIIDLGMSVSVPSVRGSSRDSPSSAATPPPPANGEPPVIITPQPCAGKPAYLSPQLVREEAHDPYASDIWSLGICL